VPIIRGNEVSEILFAVTTFGMNNHGIRTNDYRYIQYEDGLGELYDHRNDPEEWINLINDPAYDSIISAHQIFLPGKNEKWNEHSEYTFQPYFVEQKARTSKY